MSTLTHSVFTTVFNQPRSTWFDLIWLDLSRFYSLAEDEQLCGTLVSIFVGSLMQRLVFYCCWWTHLDFYYFNLTGYKTPVDFQTSVVSLDEICAVLKFDESSLCLFQSVVVEHLDQFTTLQNPACINIQLICTAHFKVLHT